MKRIYVILFAAALGASSFSCEDKTSAEKSNDHGTGEVIKDTTTHKELNKTTENGGDTH